MFNFASLKPVAELKRFDGKAVYSFVVTSAKVYDIGEYYDNAEAFIRILAEETATRTPVKWNVKFVGTAPRYYTNPKTGVVTQIDSERVSACKNLSRALGHEYTSDIGALYEALKGSVIRAVIREDVQTDSNGDAVHDEFGEVKTYFKCLKYLAPESGELPHEENMAEKINSANVAKAEAKRAEKQRKGRAGA